MVVRFQNIDLIDYNWWLKQEATNDLPKPSHIIAAVFSLYVDVTIATSADKDFTTGEKLMEIGKLVLGENAMCFNASLQSAAVTMAKLQFLLVCYLIIEGVSCNYVFFFLYNLLKMILAHTGDRTFNQTHPSRRTFHAPSQDGQ